MVIILALRFLLELCVLVILGYWGFQSGKSVFGKVIIGMTTPIIVAGIWAMFGSPKALMPFTGMWRLSFELFVFGIAALALYSSGHVKLSVIFIVVAILNMILLHLLT